jgi:hypothetical protein
MIQYDIDGSKTLVKERKPKVKKTVAKNEVAKEVKPVQIVAPVVQETENPYYMTIEKKVLLKPHQIVEVTTFNKFGSTQSEASRENLKACDGVFNGYMSDNTSRYVKRIVENWLTSIELCNDESIDYRNRPYVTFVTLTLPSKQVHHDNKIKNECLDPMLEWLKHSKEKTKRNGGGVEAYLWRAESQKNGNLHFHIIADRWIDHSKIKKQWNKIIERLGYITRYRKTQSFIYRNGFVPRNEQFNKQINNLMYIVQQALKDGKTISESKYQEYPEVRNILNAIITQGRAEKVKNEGYGLDIDTAKMLVYKMQLKAYENGVKTNWSEPNTTDIHKLGNINSISAYITKYVSKKDIVPHVLGERQQIVNHHYYGRRIVTLREGGDIKNILDWEEEYEYKPVFESRKVNGRIWGKSKNLSDEKQAKDKETGELIGKVRKIESPNFTTEIKVLLDSGNERTSQTFIQNEEILDYALKVKESIPEMEVTRLAEIINSDYCSVIPLGAYSTRINHKTKKKEKFFKIKKQTEYLDKLSPTVKARYLEHYQTLFRNIYQNAS